MDRIEGGGVIDTVRADQVSIAQRCREGWEAIGCYHDTVLEPCWEQEAGYNNSYGNPPPYGTPTPPPGFSFVQKYKPVTVTFFVLRMNEQSAVAEAERKYVLAHEAEQKAKAELAEVKKQLEVLDKDMAAVKDDLRIRKDDYNRMLSNRDQQRDISRKLEGDIAKLRTALGDLRLKEILG